MGSIPPLRELKAIIFDFDGVIVDSERMKFDSLKPILRTYGIQLKGSEYRHKTGKKVVVFLRERFGKKLTEVQIKRIANLRRAHQLQHIRAYAEPIVGIRTFLRFLGKQNIRLCLATGSLRSVVGKTLRALGMRKTFSVFVMGDEYRSSKPNPEVYRIALRKLHCKPKEVLVIEDAPAGIIAAKRLGVPCVGIATTHRAKELRKADLVVRSFAGLQKKLR